MEYQSDVWLHGPITVREMADLLCVTGVDNITRLWSCATGELLHNIKPCNAGGQNHHQWYAKDFAYSPRNARETHSVLFSSGLRWGVGIFQKEKIYVIVPWG